ncbi:hypothetical protein [Deinococcus pimensis]|uniref:hypothetical protein n=1 Tax=Deinococcus pimensis TaxID=309888 RepID=UPI00048260CF|nr:hypothetical protein [Deinococcus pimensis]
MTPGTPERSTDDIAARISQAIGENVPPPDAPDFPSFLTRLRQTHPVYAELLEGALPHSPPLTRVPAPPTSLKVRLREARRRAAERLWWRPSPLGRLVLNKRRGPLVLTTLALLIFGAYTASYFARPTPEPRETADRTPPTDDPGPRPPSAPLPSGSPEADVVAAATDTPKRQPGPGVTSPAPTSTPSRADTPFTSGVLPPVEPPPDPTPVPLPVRPPVSVPDVTPGPPPFENASPTPAGSAPATRVVTVPTPLDAPVPPTDAPLPLPIRQDDAFGGEANPDLQGQPPGASPDKREVPPASGVIYTGGRAAPDEPPTSGIVYRREEPPGTPDGTISGTGETTSGSVRAASAVNAATTGVLYTARRGGTDRTPTGVLHAGKPSTSDAARDPNVTIAATQTPSTSDLDLRDVGLAPVTAVDATLVTVLEAPLDREVPAVAQSEEGVWVGTARADPETGRMDVRFDRLVREERVIPVDAVAYDVAYNLGLAGTVQDRSPAVLQDMLRTSLAGLNAYAQGLAQAGSTTVTNGAVVTDRATPSLGAVLAGKIGRLFELPERNVSVVRTLRIERGTQLLVMRGVTRGEN